MQNTIFRYVLDLFEESRDGKLTVGDADNRFDCPVHWDAATAQKLAQRCSELVVHLTALATQYDKLLTDTRHLTREQMNVWEIFLRPIFQHRSDMEALQSIWEKLRTGEIVTVQEQALFDRYAENALMRLPIYHCAPTELINRAQRYGRLVQLNAPDIVRESEAKRFAEEFVLYHCMVQNTPK